MRKLDEECGHENRAQHNLEAVRASQEEVQPSVNLQTQTRFQNATRLVSHDPYSGALQNEGLLPLLEAQDLE
jgi:hypothetical protein